MCPYSCQANRDLQAFITHYKLPSRGGTNNTLAMSSFFFFITFYLWLAKLCQMPLNSTIWLLKKNNQETGCNTSPTDLCKLTARLAKARERNRSNFSDKPEAVAMAADLQGSSPF